MRRNWSWSALSGYRPMRRNLIEGADDAHSTLFKVGDWVQTTPDSLNRRAGPGTSYRILSALTRNTFARILPHQNNGVRLGSQRWWFAEAHPGGERGWLAESYLKAATTPPSGTVPIAAFRLATSVSGEGRVMRNPSHSMHMSGDEVEIQAVGAPGWEFHKWEGDHEGVINPAVVRMSDEKTVVAHFRRSFDAWKESQFTFAERRDADLTAPTADPFGHGVSNLAAYTFGLDAREPDRAHLPRVQQEAGGVFFVFRRLTGLTEIIPSPEISSDLSTWTPLNPESAHWEISPDADPSMEVVRVTVPETSAAAFFARLQLGFAHHRK
jgi:hypothetical protein